MALDGDAALALEVHVVERLFLQLAIRDGARGLEQAVGQGALPVVRMWAMMQKLRMFFMSKKFGEFVTTHVVHGTECTGKGTSRFTRVRLCYLYAPDTCNALGGVGCSIHNHLPQHMNRNFLNHGFLATFHPCDDLRLDSAGTSSSRVPRVKDGKANHRELRVI